MRIALVAHGYPPELRGGTENSTQALARALAARGQSVVVIAGSMDWQDGLRVSRATDRDPLRGAEFPVLRIHRSDAFFDHWQKAEHPGAGRLFDQLLAESFEGRGPDVVHVHHWIRLSNDLVQRAARLGIPSVVTLHDLWTSCLVVFRVRPKLRQFCEVPLAPEPCLACAGDLPPRPVWQSQEEGARAVLAFRAAARRELELAAALIAPSRAHGEALGRWLGLSVDELAARLTVLAPAREPRPRASQAPRVPARVTPADPLVLASFGQWSELKGTDLLIEALGATRDPARFRLLLAGSAPSPDFAARVAALAATSPAAVELLGDYDRDHVASHPVAAGALYLSGSRAHESFGLVLDEALELGQGVVVPNLGALGERAARVDWAVAYESGSAADLARLLDELADDPARVVALGAAARAALDAEPRVARAATLDEHVARTLALYTAAVSAGPPAAERVVVDLAAEEARLRAIDAWDAALGASDPHELGLA